MKSDTGNFHSLKGTYCSTIELPFVCLCPSYGTSNILLFTESQNHKMVGVGGDLCGSSSPTPLPKQGQVQQAAQDHVQAGFEYLHRRRLPQPLWAACPRAPSPSEGRSSSSCSGGTSYASVCAHCPLSFHWAPLKRVWPHPPAPTFQIFVSIY